MGLAPSEVCPEVKAATIITAGMIRPTATTNGNSTEPSYSKRGRWRSPAVIPKLSLLARRIEPVAPMQTSANYCSVMAIARGFATGS
jgi:hypothetical protein